MKLINQRKMVYYKLIPLISSQKYYKIKRESNFNLKLNKALSYTFEEDVN